MTDLTGTLTDAATVLVLVLGVVLVARFILGGFRND